MAFDADLTACAALVQRADPERFRATMAAPVAARRVLFPLYAMNVEVARAPWVTAEPLIAEMRLQWWRDALGEIASGGRVRRHEVVTPLAAVLSADQVDVLDELVTARLWDIYNEPFADEAALFAHIGKVSGVLMQVAASALGPADDAVTHDFGMAAGIAGWLRAVPDLLAHGRQPLPDASDEGIRALARLGLGYLHHARSRRASVSREAAPALLAGWRAGAVLARAEAEPWRVMAGRLAQPEGGGLALALRAATGRW